MRPCCNCGTLFEPNRDKSYRCPPCKSEYNRSHYTENKAVYVERASRRKTLVLQQNTSRIIEFLLEHPCVDCGETDPVVLEFDHIREKDRDIGRMLSDGHSWTAITNEIAKCEVRCANCHRRVTAKRAGWMRYRLND